MEMARLEVIQNMRQVVGGKIYDTATAKKIFTFGVGNIGLYKTEKGAYFLFVGGEILARSKDQALRWAENNAQTFNISVEAIVKEFPEVKEG